MMETDDLEKETEVDILSKLRSRVRTFNIIYIYTLGYFWKLLKNFLMYM